MSDAPRLRRRPPGELSAAQRRVYDAIAGGRRAQGRQLFRLTDEQGGLEGPFNAFLLQPRVGGPLQALGSAIRYETELSHRCREIAILLVARAWDSEFEWYAHEAIARDVGLTEADLEALRRGRSESFAGDEQVVAEVTMALVLDGNLDDEQYAAAVRALGEAGLFELTTLVGYYATLALQLRVFRVAAPHD